MRENPSTDRPQQARAVATRKRLLEAAVQSLCSLGYAKTTTTVIAREAGVSQGALYKQFGSKHHLIAATAGHLFDGLVETFRSALLQQKMAPSDRDTLPRMIRELWAVFLLPELYAVVELFIAARTDEPLRHALAPVVRQHRENLMTEARLLFPEAAARNPHFEAAVDLALSAMQGAAMNAAVLPNISVAGELARFLEHLGRREFEPPYGVSP